MENKDTDSDVDIPKTTVIHRLHSYVASIASNNTRMNSPRLVTSDQDTLLMHHHKDVHSHGSKDTTVDAKKIRNEKIPHSPQHLNLQRNKHVKLASSPKVHLNTNHHSSRSHHRNLSNHLVVILTSCGLPHCLTAHQLMLPIIFFIKTVRVHSSDHIVVLCERAAELAPLTVEIQKLRYGVENRKHTSRTTKFHACNISY